ncbi:hypothetical protein [Haloplanus ruber]|nr:hypothetical protein [Haloplanus ruber]
MRLNENDIDLRDLDNMTIVSVETEHEYYDEDMADQITDLSPGDILDAQIQGEDVLQPNSIWRFLRFNVIGHNRMWADE